MAKKSEIQSGSIRNFRDQFRVINLETRTIALKPIHTRKFVYICLLHVPILVALMILLPSIKTRVIFQTIGKNYKIYSGKFVGNKTVVSTKWYPNSYPDPNFPKFPAQSDVIHRWFTNLFGYPVHKHFDRYCANLETGSTAHVEKVLGGS